MEKRFGENSISSSIKFKLWLAQSSLASSHRNRTKAIPSALSPVTRFTLRWEPAFLLLSKLARANKIGSNAKIAKPTKASPTMKSRKKVFVASTRRASQCVSLFKWQTHDFPFSSKWKMPRWMDDTFSQTVLWSMSQLCSSLGVLGCSTLTNASAPRFRRWRSRCSQFMRELEIRNGNSLVFGPPRCRWWWMERRINARNIARVEFQFHCAFQSLILKNAFPWKPDTEGNYTRRSF